MSSDNKYSDDEKARDDLLKRFRKHGFNDAFGILWLYHIERLGRFVRGRMQNDDRSQDVLQEVALKLSRYLSGHVVDMTLPSAYKITKDEIASFYRAINRTPGSESLDDLVAMNLEPIAECSGGRLERWRELQDRMDACGVSRQQQTAVVLHHLIGYTYKEVAQITGSEYEAVRARLRYAQMKMGRAARQGDT